MTPLPPVEPGEQVFEVPSKPKTSGLAIASLVCAIVGFCIPVVGGILAVVLGAVALSKISKSAGATSGKGLAIAGLVVGAISILLLPLMVALLLPALFGAMNMAKATACASNLSQLGKSAQAWAASHGQQLPPADKWPDVFKKEFGMDDAVLSDPGAPSAGRAYAMNSHVRNTAAPARTVLFFDCTPGSPPGGGPELLPDRPPHPGGYNICFLDGDVRAVPPEKVNQLIWDPNAAPPGE